MEENKIKIIDQREKSLEVQIAEFLISKGIYNLEQVKELLEPSFYAVVPISILEKTTISANAKLLYAEIMALSKKSGKCFATNEYLAKRLGVSKRTIPSLLKELRDDFLVQVSIKRNKDGTYRDITLSLIGDGGYRKRAMGGIAKKRGQKRIRQKELDKENNIATFTEVADNSIDGKGINLLIHKFREVNPAFYKLFANKTQRKALERLVDKYGAKKIGQIIDFLPISNQHKFAPIITTPVELENKLGKLIAFVKQEQNKDKREIFTTF